MTTVQNNFVPGSPQDLRLVQDSVTADLDLVVGEDGDYQAVSDLSTALLVSLLTDARAADDEVALLGERRGWIGDLASPVEDFVLGSKLWINEPGKATQNAVNRSVDAARRSLQWLITQGVANSVEVTGELTGPNEATLRIIITAKSGEVDEHYLPLWRRTSFAPVAPPPLVQVQEIFNPGVVPGLVTWVDATLSASVLGDDCDVIQVSDVNGVFSFIQPTEASRPKKRITGSADDIDTFFEFDGVDDFLSVGSQLVGNFREGTIYLVYAPKAAAPVAAQRVLSLGANGFADGAGGVTVRQDGDVTSDSVTLFGVNGEISTTVQGPGGGEAYGVVFRWGPRQNGSDAETDAGQLGVGAAYSVDIAAINDVVIGSGFDGAVADTSNAGEFYLRTMAVYSRRVAASESNNLLDFAQNLDFTAPQGGQQHSDCTFFTDGFGYTT